MPHTLLCTAVTLVALNGAMPAFAQDAGPDWSTFVPPVDGSFVTWETPPDLELVKRLFTLAYPENCSWALGTGVAPEPQVFEFTYRNDYDEPDAPERPFRLYQIFCSAGAYNEQAVFMAWDESTGVRTIYFAQPAFDFVYSDETEVVIESVAVAGMTASTTLTNPVYDPETRTISFTSYWRGIGDASSAGVYAFDNGDFVLKTYDVDASYDGEVNPVRVVDYSVPHPVE